MSKELDQYRREIKIHLKHNEKNNSIIIAHLEKINGRLQQAEKDITTHKTVGITISSFVGFILTYLGIKD